MSLMPTHTLDYQVYPFTHSAAPSLGNSKPVSSPEGTFAQFLLVECPVHTLWVMGSASNHMSVLIAPPFAMANHHLQSEKREDGGRRRSRRKEGGERKEGGGEKEERGEGTGRMVGEGRREH